jgi:hypothetical protein
MKLNKRQEERLTAAIDYADRGWKVLPVGLDKKPINNNGSTGATTSQKQIVKWWMDNPFANIGVATGPESFWVVDCDVKEGKNGIATLAEYFGDKFTFEMEENLFAKTATGGIHFLFKYPDGRDVKNAQGILDGVDIRGDGGYIVVAPSARKIGDEYVPYRWNNLGLPIADAPEWALKLLTLQKDKTSMGVDLTRIMTGLGAGERDSELWRYACHLAARNVPYDIAYAFITVASDRCTPPFSHQLVKEKLDRAYSSKALPANTTLQLLKK